MPPRERLLATRVAAALDLHLRRTRDLAPRPLPPLQQAPTRRRLGSPPHPTGDCLACAESLITTPTTEAPPDARRRTYAAQGLLAAEDSHIAGYETDPATTVKGWRQSVAIHRTLQRHNQRDPVEHWTAPDADHALEQAWPLIDAPDPATAAAVVRRWMLGYQKPWPFTQADVSTFIGPLRHALDDVRAVWGTRHL